LKFELIGAALPDSLAPPVCGDTIAVVLRKFGLSSQAHIAAIDDQVVPSDHVVGADDEVVFIRIMSGG
jgi:sulfur carrier protein ThiS